MKVTTLGIDGAWIIETSVHPDSRGIFREWFKRETLNANGLPDFVVKQANTSISKKGVIRGIHYSEEIQGQAKLITCTSGSISDVVLDLRPNSTSFGEHVLINLNSREGRSIFISSGLGHGFQALEENTVVTYLLDKEYSPENEFGLNPVDPELEIRWPIQEFQISDKDASAANFKYLKESHVL
jgi:dTDP-4-dehydrorhamnose 3,5-epimerase